MNVILATYSLVHHAWMWSLPLLTPTPALVPMRACVPVNDDLVKQGNGGLGTAMTRLAGALGGALEPLAILMTVLAALTAIALSVTDKGARWFKLILVPFAVLIGLAFVIFVSLSLWKLFQGFC